MSYFENPKIAAFIAQAMNESFDYKAERVLAVDCIIALEKRDVLETRQKLELALREAEQNKGDTTVIIQKIQNLNQLLKQIEQKKFINKPKKA